MHNRRWLGALIVGFSVVAASCGVVFGSKDTPEVLRVAYFTDWPTPIQFGQRDGSFAKAVGVPIDWVPTESGTAMVQAMEAGEVDISYSLGLTPFANAVNSGARLKLVGIALSYAEADNCVVRGTLAVNQNNAPAALKGSRVMTPFGNVTHFKMLSMMEYLGVKLGDLEIVEATDNETTAAAFESGEIDVGCAFGGAVVRMLDSGGKLIMTGAEHETDIGIFTFDIVSTPESFGEQYPKVVSNFLQATDEFNSAWKADPDTQNPTIAAASGMTSVGHFLAGEVWFEFPSINEQLGADWLGGNVAETMQKQLETFERLGYIDGIKADFAGAIDSRYLEAIEQ